MRRPPSPSVRTGRSAPQGCSPATRGRSSAAGRSRPRAAHPHLPDPAEAAATTHIDTASARQMPTLAASTAARHRVPDPDPATIRPRGPHNPPTTRETPDGPQATHPDRAHSIRSASTWARPDPPMGRPCRPYPAGAGAGHRRSPSDISGTTDPCLSSYRADPYSHHRGTGCTSCRGAAVHRDGWRRTWVARCSRQNHSTPRGRPTDSPRYLNPPEHDKADETHRHLPPFTTFLAGTKMLFLSSAVLHSHA